MPAVVTRAHAAGAGLTLRQEAQERRKRLETQKPFNGTLRVTESRPAEPGQSAAGGEASLAWRGVILPEAAVVATPRLLLASTS
jgi:hypothetical protein